MGVFRKQIAHHASRFINTVQIQTEKATELNQVTSRKTAERAAGLKPWKLLLQRIGLLRGSIKKLTDFLNSRAIGPTTNPFQHFTKSDHLSSLDTFNAHREKGHTRRKAIGGRN